MAKTYSIAIFHHGVKEFLGMDVQTCEDTFESEFNSKVVTFDSLSDAISCAQGLLSDPPYPGEMEAVEVYDNETKQTVKSLS